MNNPFGYFLAAFIVFIWIVGFKQQQSDRGMAGVRYALGFFIAPFVGFWGVLLHTRRVVAI